MIVFADYSFIEWIGLISAITNTVCVVLVAKKRISNFAWGAVAVLTYAVVAFSYGHTAEWIFWGGYYLPMNFVGWYFWVKNKSKDNSREVDSKKLSLKGSVILYTVTAIATLGIAWIISLPGLNQLLYGQVFEFGFDKYLVDSFTSTMAVIAMLLMVKRYREQWVIWIIINVASLALWGIYTFDPLMILMWSCLLVNSVYGYIKWKVVDAK
jgi:nicotinamide mononucleotide transporter